MRRLTGDRAESGMTVVEVTVVLGLLSVVMVVFFSALSSLAKHEVQAQALVANEENVRLTLTQLSRDIRSANPLNTWASKTTYSTQLQVEFGPANPKTVVRWVYDTNPASTRYRTLTRHIMDTNSNSLTAAGSASGISLTNVRNVDEGVPLFTYFSQNNLDLGSSSSTFTAGDVGNCAIRVHIELVAAFDVRGHPFRVNSDVQLRNRLAGGVGCG